MFEYRSKLHPYHGETRPEDVFEVDAAIMSGDGWELVTVVPVLGKADLVSFWKRSAPSVVQAVVQAEEILDAVLIKGDAGRGELLDAANEALDVLTTALPAIPHREPEPLPSKIAITDPAVVYKALTAQLGEIGMEDRSERLPPPVPDETPALTVNVLKKD